MADEDIKKMRVIKNDLIENGWRLLPIDGDRVFTRKDADIYVKNDVWLYVYDRYYEAYYNTTYYIKDKFRSIGVFSVEEIEKEIKERFKVDL